MLILFSDLICITVIESLDSKLSSPSLVTPSSGDKVTLTQEFPEETIDFEWTAAKNSAGYDVTYQIVVLSDTATTSDQPLYKGRNRHKSKRL